MALYAWVSIMRIAQQRDGLRQMEMDVSRCPCDSTSLS